MGHAGRPPLYDMSLMGEEWNEDTLPMNILSHEILNETAYDWFEEV